MFKELASTTHITEKSWPYSPAERSMFREFAPAAHAISNQQFNLIDIRQIRHHREEKSVTITFHSRITFGNRSEIIQKWSLGGPWVCLGAFLEPPGSRLGRFLRRDEDRWWFWSVPGAPRSLFWEPAGPSPEPKFAKKWTCDQNGGVGECLWKRVLHFFVPSTFWFNYLTKKRRFWLCLDTFLIDGKTQIKDQACFQEYATNLENRCFI